MGYESARMLHSCPHCTGPQILTRGGYVLCENAAKGQATRPECEQLGRTEKRLGAAPRYYRKNAKKAWGADLVPHPVTEGD